MKFNKESLLLKLKNKYRLTVHNEATLEEVWKFHLSRLNLFTYIGIFVMLIAFLVILLFVFTPLNAFLPSYTDSKLQRQVMENIIRIDSLEQQIKMRDIYLENLKNVLQGKNPNDYFDKRDTTTKYSDIKLRKSQHDSVLRKQIESEEQSNLSVIKNPKSKNPFEHLHFFVPVKGYITAKFNPSESHYGIDIAASPTEAVLATLDGTVVMATWTLETGYVIQIQHDNNLVSVYKHNSILLKKSGDHVNAGEGIAIVGNSGELTTGPHLHFELWHNGVPVNPEDYIVL